MIVIAPAFGLTGQVRGAEGLHHTVLTLHDNSRILIERHSKSEISILALGESRI
jgi:hypothetical protein